MFVNITSNPTAGATAVPNGTSPLNCHRVTAIASTTLVGAMTQGQLEVSPPQQAGTGEFTAHYLPWGSGDVYRTVLPPRNIQGADGNLFFTANMTGCAVAVAGSPTVPVVYHANAAATLNQALNGMADRDKIGWSEATMVTAIGQFEPPAQTPLDPPMQVLLPSQYLSPDREGVTTREHLMIMRESRATVFGVRKNGAWTFYYQKGIFTRTLDTNTAASTDQFVVEEFGELWPTRRAL